MTHRLLGKYLSAILAVGLLLAELPRISSAQAETSLVELLRSTHVHGLAVDRSDSGRLLIATHHGLHAVRIDTGKVEPVSVRRDDFMGFTPHPADPKVLYASGHPANGGNLGFIASADGGKTWERLSPGVRGPVDFHQMDVSKSDPKTIYGVHEGLQISRDGGRTWERVGPAPEGLIDFTISAKTPSRLYAATQQGLVVSQDGGRSWRPAHVLRRPASLVETTADGTVYAFVVGSGLLQAEEPSLTWRTVNNAFGARYLLHLAIDPKDADRLFAATQTGELMASGDRGTTWRVLAAP
ncbi:MAG: exo-alpha-sialidase [Alphaproteobacteria bacterium]|nr:exo-alpha-sialidase [Alphaproteobacteria bacterium]